MRQARDILDSDVHLRLPMFATQAFASWILSCPLLAQLGGFVFDDVSEEAGILGGGPSFGPGAWGDWNGDGFPDLWVGNHANPPFLYVNQGDGRFEVLALSFLDGKQFGDAHGAAWADCDGDGDQDLIELVGAGSGVSAPNQLWWNDAGKLTDIGMSSGLGFPPGRGRTPLWMDWNRDNRLDLLAVNLYRPNVSATMPFVQTSQAGQVPSFALDWPASGFSPTTQVTEFASLADLSGDGVLDLIVDGAPYPSAVYDISRAPMVDVLRFTSFRGITSVVDAVYSDFDNDGWNDVFLCRDRIDNENEAALIHDRELRCKLSVRADEVGFSVQSDQSLRCTLPEGANFRDIQLGYGGVSPIGLSFELNPDNLAHQGIAPHQPGVDRGVYIGFDPIAARWTILLSSPGRSQLGLILLGGPMRDAILINSGSGTPLEDSLLMRTSNGFQVGLIDIPGSSRSVVSGDFDNDTDLDLYLVRAGAAVNRPNVLLENLGGGSFRVVLDAGARLGASGAAGSTRGLGDGVNTADFDVDGWLDLFVTQGFGNRFYSEDGPHQLFRNRGAELYPDRHWLLVDLVGPGGNLDAIGAQVRIRMGSQVLLREQNGGMHRFGQNHMRLHFGLGAATLVDGVDVLWPDGTSTRLGAVAADQILEIRY
jgi:ASPIC and UnbV/FG-GAP-like repeat